MAKQPAHSADIHFTQPLRQVVSMAITLGLVAFGASLALPSVKPVFLANPYLNGFIAIVFVIGVVACFWQVWQIFGSVRWISRYTSPQGTRLNPPRLLAPLAAMLRSRGRRMNISAMSSRSILDSVATRIDEARDITRYLTSLLIFLGLLGTFYGLATTVPAVVETIRSLAPQEGDQAVDVFDRLMTGLEAQLGGMGVAFASSLLGLAGSLVVGLLELFAGHGQNRFYRELEEWMSTITTLGFEASEGDGGAQTLAAFATHMAEQIDGMREVIQAEMEGRSETDARVAELVGAMHTLTDRMARVDNGTAEAMDRIATGQDRIADALEDGSGFGGLDAESRMRLRSIDVQMLRLLEELATGRQETTAELRSEIAGLARTLRGPLSPTLVPPRRPAAGFQER